MNRKILPEVQGLFDKYGTQVNTRRLPKDQAILMLQTEFNIEVRHAEEFFRHYKLDADNSEIISLWEFQHFYNNVGKGAADVVSKFEALDTENTGFLPLDKVRQSVEGMKSSDGQAFAEKEITFFIKTAAKDSDLIDLGQFSDLIARVRMYKKPPKRS